MRRTSRIPVTPMTPTFLILSEDPLPPVERDIILNVPQGIGDIFWVYQKFAPHFDRIHINITGTEMNVVQRRAADWLRLWPKVGRVAFKVVPGAEYEGIVQATHSTRYVLDTYSPEHKEFNFAANRPLETGVRLEDIDPGLEVAVDVPVTATECPLIYPEFVAAYVSGGTKQLGAIQKGVWDMGRWARLLLGVYDRFNWTLPMIFVGASYDQEVTMGLVRALKSRGRDCHAYIDSYPANVLYILKRAKCFLGYQSGLNIMADNLGTKQLMLYYKELEPMMYSWCKKEHIGTTFQANTFDKSVEQVLDECDLRL